MTPKQIHIRIKARNMTVAALADQISVARSTLSKWLSTGDIPPYGRKAIAEALGFKEENEA